MRAFALYAVVLAHLGSMSAYISMFCFGFVMQLFFFVSGLFASRYNGMDWWPLIKKLSCSLLLPHAVLCVINLGWYASKGYNDVALVAKQCILAIRGDMRFAALWFLPCLFLMTVFYRVLNRLISKPLPRLLLCLGISLCIRLFKETSQWVWSADSALMFLFYYAAGDVLMPRLQSFDPGALGGRGKAALGLLTLLCCGLTVYFYFLQTGSVPMLFGIPYSEPMLKIAVFLLSSAAIWVVFLLSWLLQGLRVLQLVGQNTLVAFGIQGISSEIMAVLLWYLGISWIPWADWQVPFFGLASLMFCVFVIALPLKKLLPFLFGGKLKKRTAA